MIQGFTVNCKGERWYLKEQRPDMAIHLEMLGYQNKQTFIVYWTISRKSPSEHKLKMTEETAVHFQSLTN